MRVDRQKTTVKGYFMALRMLHIAMLISIVFFGIIALVLVSTVRLTSPAADFELVMIIIVSAFSVVGFLVGNMLFRKHLSRIQPNASLPEKLATYRTVLITRYALLEAPGLFTIVAYMLTSDPVFLLIAGFIILVFISMLPTISKAISDLRLNLSEQAQINNPESELQFF